MHCIASRAKCHAGGGPLERRVRPHLAAKRCTGCGNTPQPGPADAPDSGMAGCSAELTSERQPKARCSAAVRRLHELTIQSWLDVGAMQPPKRQRKEPWRRRTLCPCESSDFGLIGQ